jgi:pimeloyl-ACP methyl ester carboxylesterase
MQKQITIDDRTMHVEDCGNGPAVLFGHSFLWNHTMWAAQRAVLSPFCRCILPDLWSHGDSDRAPGVCYSVDRLAEDYVRLLDHLEIEKVAIVGHSVGGMWGAQLALSHPERVSCLALLNTFVGAEPEAKRERYFGMLDTVEALRTVPAEIVDDIIPLFFSPASIAAELPSIEAFCDALEEWPSDKISGLAAVGRGIFARPDLLPRLAELACPLLVIGGEHDASRPAEESAEMAQVAPDARLKILNCGHLCVIEQHAAVSHALYGFLDELAWVSPV